MHVPGIPRGVERHSLAAARPRERLRVQRLGARQRGRVAGVARLPPHSRDGPWSGPARTGRVSCARHRKSTAQHAAVRGSSPSSPSVRSHGRPRFRTLASSVDAPPIQRYASALGCVLRSEVSTTTESKSSRAGTQPTLGTRTVIATFSYARRFRSALSFDEAARSLFYRTVLHPPRLLQCYAPVPNSWEEIFH